MDKDRIKGSAEQVKGKMKEVAGKVTRDSKLESEGKANQVKGKIQNTIGGIKGRPARQVIPHVLITWDRPQHLRSTPARMVPRRTHVF
jgi:uncharacterized protein YjbJ (UPF0337 family)